MPGKKKKYNSRFPPARIKKIMQSDDEVGKVAAPVPVIISRVLELFVNSVLTRAGEITLSRHARTLTPLHLKQCISSDKRFDFLQDLFSSIPDFASEAESEVEPITPNLEKVTFPEAGLSGSGESSARVLIRGRGRGRPRGRSSPSTRLQKRPRGRPRRTSSFISRDADEEEEDESDHLEIESEDSEFGSEVFKETEEINTALASKKTNILEAQPPSSSCVLLGGIQITIPSITGSGVPLSQSINLANTTKSGQEPTSRVSANETPLRQPSGACNGTFGIPVSVITSAENLSKQRTASCCSQQTEVDEDYDC